MKLKESETLELKKSTSELKEAIVSIVAILNKHSRGELYFGVRNDSVAVGQSVSEKTIREISQSISENIEPKIYPKVREEEITGKDCIVVNFEGTDAPYFAFGRAYMRVGDENRQLSAKELEKIFLRKNRERLKWDSWPSEYKLKDINGNLLRQYIEKANIAGRISFSFDNKESILKKLGLIRDKKLLKAAEVLFCNKNSLKVQLAVFAGNDKLTFLDIQMYEGNIFDLIEKSEQYLKEKMNWRAEISGLQRKEIPEIPMKALREAIINSFCHRDYYASESNYVAVFKDRIDISNPGRFPEGLEPQDFISGEHESVLRNPLIAEVLYKSKEIEHWGSGLKRICDECKVNKVKVEFELRKSGFAVTFYRPFIGITPPPTPPVPPLAGATELETKIHSILAANPRMSRTELADNLGIKLDTVKEYIKRLKNKKLLKRIGTTSKGHWEVKKNL